MNILLFINIFDFKQLNDYNFTYIILYISKNIIIFMYIQKNKLLPPTSRIIKPYYCGMIATEGPNILGRLDLIGVEIPYNTQYTGRLILNPGTSNQPMLYGFLDKDITFMLLKITYNELDPRCLIEENQYIEYYFSTNKSEIRYANKLLLLTGNSIKRIPQVYLNNPGDSTVIIDVMVASLDQSDTDISEVTEKLLKLEVLYSNNIITDSLHNTVTDNYGSTEFQILNFEDDVPLLYLKFMVILSIIPDEEHTRIIINTTSETNNIIYLDFLSKTEMYQTLSKMNYVMLDPMNRTITKTSPDNDTIPPIISKTVKFIPVIDEIYMMEIQLNELGKFNITKENIIDYFISDIYDDRDGDINNYNLVTTIRKFNEVTKIDKISEDGAYDIIMTIADNANNTTFINFTIIINTTPPIITFKHETDIFSSNLSDIPTNELTIPMLRSLTVANISDSVRGLLSQATPRNILHINTSDYVIIITDNNNTEYETITTPGNYNLEYIVTDLSDTIKTYNKTINVTN